MKRAIVVWAAATAALPAAAAPPAPPANLDHLKVEGIAIACQRRPDRTRPEACRIMAGEGLVSAQTQWIANDGTYDYGATRVCTLSDGSKQGSAKRAGIVDAGKLFNSGLPKDIAALEAMPNNPQCPPAPVSPKGSASFPSHLDKALVVLDSFWRR
ncbi:MAG: hypothetical protein ACK4YM_03140 [Novosphingobium sp.]